VGSTSAFGLAAHLAERDGVDPLIARALVDPSVEPANGFLALPGWTGGASLSAPVGTRITARGGADVDIDARQLVAVLGALEVHDPCNCVVLRLTGAHRLGRPGTDVWLTVSIPMSNR
jgi:hypothetical protein